MRDASREPRQRPSPADDFTRAALTARNEDVPLSVSRPVLVTGGAGFLGTNLCERLLALGLPVLVLDNLSHPEAFENWRGLSRRYPSVELERADVRDRAAVRRCVADAQVVFHLAAQASVGASLRDPRTDFEVNALGTLNLLEEVRGRADKPPFIYASTHEIYGALGEIVASPCSYAPRSPQVREHGVSVTQALDYTTPFACSKGTADQTVLTYARNFNIPAVSLRLGSAYGPHQRGGEEQGFVALFVARAAKGQPITIFGDGRQVRDLVFADDLVDALLRAWSGAQRLRGRAFNVGGGPENATTLLELLDTIEEVCGARPELRLADWRPCDQRYYVSDARPFTAATGWLSSTSVSEGVARLFRWLQASWQETASAAQRVTQ